MTTSLTQVAKMISKDYKLMGTWRKVGRAWSLNPGLAFKIAIQGYEPKSPVIRTRLDLPAMVEVSACPKCGGVHIKQRCDAGRWPRREFVDPLGVEIA